VTDVKDAIINAGCPADPNAFNTSMRGVLALNSKCRGLRVIACSALTTAWISSGRLSAHFGYDLSSWDLVAGALLIQEAGGKVSDLDGTPYKLETRNMLCSNGLVHDEVLNILREADAVSFTRSTE
jgi:myo-inositol-1(or 4)-monophosphatase